MSGFHQALSVPVEEDLLPLSALLHQHGVVHRIFEEGGRQVVMVRRAEQAPQVEALYRAWRAGQLQIELSQAAPAAHPVPSGMQWRNAPVTLALIVLSIGGFLLVYLPVPSSWVSNLTFTPFRVAGDQLQFGQFDGQYWRLVTPVFLHFSWLHIAFNSLWLWELGRRVEQVIGQLHMLMLFLVVAVVSNTCQAAFGGAGLFGGMSGVVYGLLGFAWVAPLLQPRWAMQPAPAVMWLMLGWLVACLAGMVEVLGFGAIANAAHVAGLVCGAALGAVFGAVSAAGGDKA
ncbi:MAG: rhomboid family intramembrane serine protease [Halioglobus sp.]